MPVDLGRGSWTAQEFREGIDVRVSVRPEAGSAGAFDGAWWPRTRDLAQEVPELIAALDRRGLQVERFTYALGAWSSVAPRKILVRGRTVRTGGFSAMDPQTVCLTIEGGGRRLDLVVVPPEADALTGARALRISTRPGPRTPLLVLAAAGCPPVPQVARLATVRAS